MDEGARAGDAGLAGRGEDAGEDARLGLLQVGVGEDDVGALAAELERDTARGARRRATPIARAGLDSPPVKAILATSRMVDQRLARRAVAGDDVDDARRECPPPRRAAPPR